MEGQEQSIYPHLRWFSISFYLLNHRAGVGMDVQVQPDRVLVELGCASNNWQPSVDTQQKTPDGPISEYSVLEHKALLCGMCALKMLSREQMLGKNHGKSYRGTRIWQPASCQTPESFLHSGYLGKKAVPQIIPTGLLAGRHRRGIRSHSLSLWKAEAWLWGIRAPWDFVLLFVWSPCGSVLRDTRKSCSNATSLLQACCW